MGIATAMPNVNIAAVVGACYTGAIFGDKLSPLSDTTILAALSTKNDIFDHIKHMTKTVVPDAVIGVIVYLIMGISSAGTPAAGYRSLRCNHQETIHRRYDDFCCCSTADRYFLSGI